MHNESADRHRGCYADGDAQPSGHIVAEETVRTQEQTEEHEAPQRADIAARCRTSWSRRRIFALRPHWRELDREAVDLRERHLTLLRIRGSITP